MYHTAGNRTQLQLDGADGVRLNLKYLLIEPRLDLLTRVMRTEIQLAAVGCRPLAALVLSNMTQVNTALASVVWWETGTSQHLLPPFCLHSCG